MVVARGCEILAKIDRFRSQRFFINLCTMSRQSLRSFLVGLLMTVALGIDLSGLAAPMFSNANATVVMLETQRIHVFFSGKVQGVGFRQSAHDFAVELGIRGWVKNLDDMRVEMVAEGDELDLKLLIGKLRKEFKIDKVEVKSERPDEPLHGFEIVQ